MLVLTRKVGERIQIGDQITLSVIRVQNGKVRIGIEAPDDVRVRRDELESDIRTCSLSDRSKNAVDAATTATTRIFLTY
jgi:carbon storage regulator